MPVRHAVAVSILFWGHVSDRHTHTHTYTHTHTHTCARSCHWGNLWKSMRRKDGAQRPTPGCGAKDPPCKCRGVDRICIAHGVISCAAVSAAFLDAPAHAQQQQQAVYTTFLSSASAHKRDAGVYQVWRTALHWTALPLHGADLLSAGRRWTQCQEA